MRRPRVAVLGSPQAAVPSLVAAIEAFDVVGVITQPGRPHGRGRRIRPTPVAQAAESAGVPVQTPQTPQEVIAALESMAPLDVALVTAYGRILRPAALAVPRAGLLNLHFSILPRWRGAAPVIRSVLAGDDRSGLSIMRLDEGLDTGPVYATWSRPLRPSDRSGPLTEQFARRGARLLTSTARAVLGGSAVAVPQPQTGATMADKITSDDRIIRWDRPADEVRRQIHGLSPHPGARTTLDGETFQVLAVTPTASLDLEPGSGSAIGGH
ncbi:MAG: methionyl-tRNA formyltransferase, partial [Acidimicrobiia bacterium]|nr:methionyl-tRNA formyltransferase [Acidimicrobiia bacterium]